MSKILETYIFKGFGFDVLLKNVALRSVHGEEYPDINMNEVKLRTAKSRLNSKQRINGYQLKFLRTFLTLSIDDVSHKIQVPASTLRTWENNGNDFTGLTIEQEKAFRILAIYRIIESEKNQYGLSLTLTKEFTSPKKQTALDLEENLDYSFVSNR